MILICPVAEFITARLTKKACCFMKRTLDDYIVIEDTTKQLGIKVNTVIPRSKMYLRVSFIQKVTWILVAVLIAIIISASVLFSKQMVYLSGSCRVV